MVTVMDTTKPVESEISEAKRGCSSHNNDSNSGIKEKAEDIKGENAIKKYNQLTNPENYKTNQNIEQQFGNNVDSVAPSDAVVTQTTTTDNLKHVETMESLKNSIEHTMSQPSNAQANTNNNIVNDVGVGEKSNTTMITIVRVAGIVCLTVAFIFVCFSR